MSESIGELFLGIKKRKEELETENNDLNIKNGAMRMENIYLTDRISVLEAHIKNTERRNRPSKSRYSFID